jgi:hypothetical protein
LSCTSGYVSYNDGSSTSCKSCNSGYTNVKTCSVDASDNITPLTCYDSYYLKTETETDTDGTVTTTLSCESCNNLGNGANVLECA